MANFYVVLDTETGGLSPEKADVLTIYLAIVDSEFSVLDELDLKLKPNNGAIPVADAGALRVNGINIQAHIENPNTLTYSESKTKIITLLRKYLKKNGRYSNLRPLGQNIPFDLGFIWKYLIPKEEWDGLVHYGLIDTKSISDFFKDAGVFPKEVGSLGSIVEFLGVQKRNAHAAKDDALMTLDVYKKMLEIMKSKTNSAPQTDIISLLEME